MFGADTPLVMDALQISAIALAVGGGAVWLVLRRKLNGQTEGAPSEHQAGSLEDRVRVLERIATDSASEEKTDNLASEIEALREAPKPQEMSG